MADQTDALLKSLLEGVNPMTGGPDDQKPWASRPY